LRPDVIALNEVCVPLQTARLLRDSAIPATGIPYKLVQQTRVNGLSKVEGEALLTRFAIVETGNLDDGVTARFVQNCTLRACLATEG
jgi:hypothetical protein